MQERPFSLRFINAVRVILAFVIPIFVLTLCAQIMDSIGIANTTFTIILFCAIPALFSLFFLVSLAQDWNDAANESYDDFIGNYEKFKISWEFVQTRFHRTLFATGILLIVQLFIYLAIRMVWGCLVWLKNGNWPDATACYFLNIFCYNDTGFVGLNQILNWFGNSDTFYTLMPIMFIGIWFLKITDLKRLD
jgi:hypothetical protein